MKKRFEFEQRYKPKAVIDITALIDLVFLLVVFFMVTSSLGKISSISVNLPFARESGERELSRFVVTINSDNAMFINDERIPDGGLEEAIAARKEELEEGVVLIRGDKESSYETVIRVMDTLKKSGISSFTLSTVSGR
ncbi:MAG: ExbD/TolR family protein [Spirochaetota bacterium]